MYDNAYEAEADLAIMTQTAIEERNEKRKWHNECLNLQAELRDRDEAILKLIKERDTAINDLKRSMLKGACAVCKYSYLKTKTYACLGNCTWRGVGKNA